MTSSDNLSQSKTLRLLMECVRQIALLQAIELLIEASHQDQDKNYCPLLRHLTNDRERAFTYGAHSDPNA